MHTLKGFSISYPFFIFVLIFVSLLRVSLCADPTLPPKPKKPPPPRPETGYVNPIKDPIYNSNDKVHVRIFARLPLFESATVPGRKSPARIVGMTSLGKNLYVTTSTAGAMIYRIRPDGIPSRWANIQHAVKRDTGRNVNCETTQHGGLRGLAFPPDHWSTGLFYVSYMEDRPKKNGKFRYLSKPNGFAKQVLADSVVVEFKYDWTKRQIVPGSYRTVIRIGLFTKDHPIKQITFQGRYLLIGHGDGALGSNPSPGGMNNDGLGKILRIDPRKNGNQPYRIPKTNPFRFSSVYMPEIFAMGFRNPHNICYSKRHGIFVADVGRDNIEEVNIVTAGGNYGWGAREGTFVNLRKGGTLTGIKPLPRDDAKFRYTYPVVQVGHFQPEGGQIRWGIAIAGSCPIENGSIMDNRYFFANFGERGELFYSWVGAMRRARTKGPPNKLTQAKIHRVRKIMFDHDGKKSTPPILVDSLVKLVSIDANKQVPRADARFGRGPRGEIYITSKVTGSIYLITSSVPKWKP